MMYHRSRGVRLGLIAVCVYAIAVATRLAPLHWSPLPATLDGFVHANNAARTLAEGQVPLTGQRADQLTSPVMLGMASAVTDIEPLYLAQPLYGIVGAATVLVAVGFALRLARTRGWHPGRTASVVLLAGLAVAVEGLFVRRTGVPDDEAFTLLLIPLAAFALVQYLRGRHRGWLTALLPMLFILPLTHTFSSLIGALTLTALVSAELLRRPTWKTAPPAVGVAVAFWVFMAGYYEVATLSGLTVPYVGRVSSYPGLFLAWTIVLVLGMVWYQRTAGWVQRGVVLVPLGLFFAVMLINRAVSVFPGTPQTPLVVLALILPLAVPVAVAGWAAPLLGEHSAVGVVMLALLAAPVSHVLFGLTAALNPAFFATVLRAQTFGHIPVLVVAAAGAVGVLGGSTRVLRRSDLSVSSGDRVASDGGWSRGRTVMILVVVVALVGTAPVAYLNLDTGSYPTGATETEYAAAGFVATHGDEEVATDHKQGRLVGFRGGGAGVASLVSWLDGGSAPEAALVSKGYWTTTGAHLFPGAPRTVSERRFGCTLAERHRVYHTDGIHAISVTLPATGASVC